MEYINRYLSDVNKGNVTIDVIGICANTMDITVFVPANLIGNNIR